MTDDILQEVPESEIETILEVFKKDWPKHFLIHQYITIMQEYRKANITNPQQVLYRYGNIEDGVYLVTTKIAKPGKTFNNIFLYTASADLAGLDRVMAETSRVLWDDFCMEITSSRYTPAVVQGADAHGFKVLSARNYQRWYPPEEKLDLRPLPEDVYLGYLDDSHVQEVNDNWPHKLPGSDAYIAVQIKNNFGLGLFRKSDNKMLSSSLCMHSGGIFVLYSHPEFRGKGYAEIIVKHMIQELRQRGRIPFAAILLENTPSQKLFEKIGFKIFDTVDFIFPGTE